MQEVLQVSIEQNLSTFSQYLWQLGIPHRITERNGQQVLWIADAGHAGAVRGFYQQWQSGEVVLPSTPVAHPRSLQEHFSLAQYIIKMTPALLTFPVTLALIMLCLLLAFLTQLGANRELLVLFLYPDFYLPNGQLALGQLALGQTIDLARTITPIFLHFSILHLAFNLLWLWELGRAIEAKEKSLQMFLLVMLLAFVSNTTQYLYTGSIAFGGMSGVVYGLLGYCWMFQLIAPEKGIGISRPLVIFMLVTLALMMVLASRWVANAAHLGGLLTGVLYGALRAILGKIL